MLSIYRQAASPHADVTRRELLRVGGLSLLGLSAAELARLRATAAPGSPAEKNRRNACIFIFLLGGPSHIDLWDMKPRAPLEIRGEFKPVATKVQGIQLCEHLPLLAGQLDKLCLLRSMTHDMNVHGPACSEVFSGRPYFGPPTTDQASREDWPSLSAIAMRHGEPRGGWPPSVVLPWYVQFPGQSKRIAGQTGGRMGENYNAMLIQGDLSKADFELQGLRIPADTTDKRLRNRRALLEQVESDAIQHVAARPETGPYGRDRGRAYSLIENRAGDVLELHREPAPLRERYGSTTFGQSLLLARRVVEAGVPLVTVNWEDETKIDGVNTCWDTHQNNFPKLKDLLCPIFDRAFSAVLADLHERGLLETTLVVALGEFGRTPKMGQFTQSSNTQKTGRDHWPHAFTALLAGAGVRGGQVYGATTSTGGYVADKPVSPADLSATILHHLGIDFTREYVDEFQRLPHRLSDGAVIQGLG